MYDLVGPQGGCTADAGRTVSCHLSHLGGSDGLTGVDVHFSPNISRLSETQNGLSSRYVSTRLPLSF